MRVRNSAEYVMKRTSKPLKVAEVGVFKGGNALRLLTMNIEKLYLIDPYKEWTDMIFHPQKEADEAKNIMLERINKHPKKDKVKFIQKTSIEGSKLFEDSFFDFVYIDGNHQYDSLMADLIHWYPKVKKGGYFGGHDYCAERVASAVKDFAKERGLDFIGFCKVGNVDIDDMTKDWLIEL